MWKFMLKMGVIIFVNLFAFLIVWNILDTIFWTEWKFLIGSLVVSILPLLFIMSLQIKKTKEELQKITTKKPDNNGRNN